MMTKNPSSAPPGRDECGFSRAHRIAPTGRPLWSFVRKTIMSGASQSVVPAHGPHALASGVEHIPATVYSSSSQASKAVAHEIAALINLKAARGEKTVLGLATGSTPTGVYDELIRLHEEDGLSFKNVITFNLDEYWPMDPENLQSYRRFMREHLFDQIAIQPQNAHVPDGTVPLEKV